MEENTRIFVCNVPKAWNEFDVFRLFKPFGVVDDVSIPTTANQREGEHVAFVEMRTSDGAKRAVDGLQGFRSLSEVRFASYEVGFYEKPTFTSDLSGLLKVQPAKVPAIMKTAAAAAINAPVPLVRQQQGQQQQQIPKECLTADRQNLIEHAFIESQSSVSSDTQQQQQQHQQQSQDFSSILYGPVDRFNSKRVKIRPDCPKQLKLDYGKRIKIDLVDAAEYNPFGFFARLTKNTGNFISLEHQLTAIYGFMAKDGFFPKEMGELCAGHTKDDRWRRLMFCGETRKKNNITSFRCKLIDYGCKEWFDEGRLQPFDKQLLDQPVFASNLGLFGLARALEAYPDLLDSATENFTKILLSVGSSKFQATALDYGKGGTILVKLETLDVGAKRRDLNLDLIETLLDAKKFASVAVTIYEKKRYSREEVLRMGDKCKGLKTLITCTEVQR